MRLRNNASGWHAAGEPDIAANCGAAADGNPAEDGCAGVNDNIILYDGMPCRSFEQGAVIVNGESFGPEGHSLLETHVCANDSGFADDNAGAMVDKKAAADLGSRMNIDSGIGMGNLGDDAGGQRRA